MPSRVAERTRMSDTNKQIVQSGAAVRTRMSDSSTPKMPSGAAEPRSVTSPHVAMNDLRSNTTARRILGPDAAMKNPALTTNWWSSGSTASPLAMTRASRWIWTTGCVRRSNGLRSGLLESKDTE